MRVRRVRSCLAVGLLSLIGCFPEMPPEAELVERFPARRAALESIRFLSDQDPHVIRIAPTFTRLDSNWAWPRPDSLLGFSRARWDRYRQLFRQIDAAEGLWREAGGTYVVVRARGLANSGVAVGYAYLPEAPKEGRLVASIDSADRVGYLFRHLTDHWYVFEERKN